MVTVDDYIARIEGTCGEEKDIVVVFKYDKKDEAVKKILERARAEKTIAGLIFELVFKNHSFRIYTSGKAIFRSLKSKEELKALLADLLL
jgi:TATA-box binding protein (TBP) (component of TFIID and TFIIIB)